MTAHDEAAQELKPLTESDVTERMVHIIAQDIKRQFNGKTLPGVPEEIGCWTATGGTLECSEIAQAAYSIIRPMLAARDARIGEMTASLAKMLEFSRAFWAAACMPSNAFNEQPDVIEARALIAKEKGTL